jgi:SAM-dependent methyltransferase
MSIAPYVPSPEFVIRKMLELAELRSGEKLYDLGSGDGRIVIAAARDFNAEAFGIEIKEDLVAKSTQRVKELGLESRAHIIHGNFLEVDLFDADVVTVYLTTSANAQVKPKLERQLRPGARVVSHDYEFPGWTPTKVESLVEPGGTLFTHTLYLYKFTGNPLKKNGR